MNYQKWPKKVWNPKIIKTGNEIKANKNKIKTLPTKKSQGPNRFTAEFYINFREELTSQLLKLFNETEPERVLPNSCLEASVTLIPKRGKDPPIKDNTGQSH